MHQPRRWQPRPRRHSVSLGRLGRAAAPRFVERCSAGSKSARAPTAPRIYRHDSSGRLAKKAQLLQRFYGTALKSRKVLPQNLACVYTSRLSEIILRDGWTRIRTKKPPKAFSAIDKLNDQSRAPHARAPVIVPHNVLLARPRLGLKNECVLNIVVHY